MKLEEMAFDMARTLLANPDDEMIEIWRRGDEWGWRRVGEAPAPPVGAEIIMQDRVQNRDADATGDPMTIANYAYDIIGTMREHTTPSFLSNPSTN